ncbi:MAG: hypothetical protein JXB48_13485 [Candidatus Latescibacteria bacterium]|nr:hypothetical protein [Candidatus Latescibacterota bacterium]
MFKQLLKIWSEQAFSQQMINEFLTMLDDSEKMLSYAFKVLIQESKGKKFDKKIYQKDKKINLAEREIRKKVLIHLSTNPTCNLPACLALISVAKDAERLGDYVKNIFELRDLLKDPGKSRALFERLFEKNGTELMELFGMVSTAFENSDRELACKAIASGHEIAKRCEDIIEEVASSDYSPRQAVVLALGARYIKRIAVHLTNIVTSVTNPLPELDFVGDKPVENSLKSNCEVIEIEEKEKNNI